MKGESRALNFLNAQGVTDIFLQSQDDVFSGEDMVSMDMWTALSFLVQREESRRTIARAMGQGLFITLSSYQQGKFMQLLSIQSNEIVFASLNFFQVLLMKNYWSD